MPDNKRPEQKRPDNKSVRSIYLPSPTMEDRKSLAKVCQLTEEALASGEPEFTISAGDGKQIRMPVEAVEVLKKISQFMSFNSAVTTWRRDLEMGMDAAAKSLGIPPPELAELVASGEISNVGSDDDPRLKLADVLAVRQRIDDEQERNRVIANDLEYELGVYDEPDPLPVITR